MSDNNAQSTSSNVLNEYDERKRKKSDLKELGVMAHPERFERSHSISEVIELAKDKNLRTVEEITAGAGEEFTLGGRLMLMRPHGKLTFAKLADFSGEIQVCFMQDYVGVDSYKLLKKIDVADFIGATGELFMTKHGELTLLVKKYTLLGKTLRPLPDKYHGLKDTESKYRYRYLDLLCNKDTKDRFLFRTRFIKELRSFLDENKFLEVETPILTSIPSGATAKPFVTHHNALDIDVYLRIAPETYLKRCIVGGFERVFEVAKCFRNEGIDPSHLQEFTMVEYYAAYWNYEDNMNFTEELLSHLINKLLGRDVVELMDRDGNMQQINFATPWPRLDFVELIKGDCGIDIMQYYGDSKALNKAIKDKGIVIDKAETMGYGNLCDALYKKVSRPKLIQPCFVIKHPVETKPLARRNDNDPRLADTFQVLVNTWEVVNAYSELVDPDIQRESLMKQAEDKANGDEEAMPMDDDYILAMEHGMPPISGWGMGIDRIIAILTNQDNLKDTVLFPIMRPEDSEQPE